MEINCTNCGATLSFDYAANAYQCGYCGSIFQHAGQQQQATAQGLEAGCIPFQKTLDDFRQAVIEYLTTGDQTPVDALPNASIDLVEQVYYPFYTGDEQKRPFPKPIYGGDSDYDGESITPFAIRTDLKQIIPISRADTSGIRLQPTNLQATGLFYYPGWFTLYEYQGHSFLIFMNGVTGEISGTRPQNLQIAAPARLNVLKKYALIGLGLWFGILVLRAALGAFIGHPFDTHAMNNPLFSEPAEMFWFIRGLIFVVIFPLLMISVFYPKITEAYYQRFRVQRGRIAKQAASHQNTFLFLKTNT
ncbi:hypothetical protein C8P68_1059 [Mucilaginibacter yixingensis]|uniref:Uncharacterized protein n=1 Tax=Mucilaginibacter yixingensis TaxID=1295612 RepID=A0A2T5J7Y7_9SPHI|nr:hypothetical protein [Mucilaginibacter yixingensis]PTQ95504.1 hypothetical protein C8P68_1059 [Mucilaginibacter yixingensis]